MMQKLAEHEKAQDLRLTSKETPWFGILCDLYMALLKERLLRDGMPLDAETLSQQFRLHLHRGIAYLAGNRELRKIDDWAALAVAPPDLRGGEEIERR